jgi:UDP-N-acetylglucosamine 2-epimerase (non-hydrolysing)
MIINLVLGTRPQIIKSAPLINSVSKYEDLRIEVIHTGQHYDYQMSKQFFNEFNLTDPIVNLNIGSGSHAWQTAEMLKSLEDVFIKRKPDMVLVPGDTNSTLAGALAAVKMKIPLAHFEAGARSNDMSMPEEVNRKLSDHCSNLLFTVSSNCSKNLINEGIKKEKIYLVGDTMYENLLKHQGDINNLTFLNSMRVEKDSYILLTLHRQENVDDLLKLKIFFTSLLEQDLLIIFPCHPRTKERLIKANLYNKINKTIKVIDPLPYSLMLNLIKNSKIVLTDSGGIQKEAYWLKKPCITLRKNTEWIETIIDGANVLVDIDSENISQKIDEIIFKKVNYSSDLFIPNASFNILSIIEKICLF